MLFCVLCICSNGRDQKWLLNYPEWETCTGICTRQMYTGICLWVLGIQHWFSGREASSLNSMASLQYLNLYFNNVVKLHFKCVCVCKHTQLTHTQHVHAQACTLFYLMSESPNWHKWFSILQMEYDSSALTSWALFCGIESNSSLCNI